MWAPLCPRHAGSETRRRRGEEPDLSRWGVESMRLAAPTARTACSWGQRRGQWHERSPEPSPSSYADCTCS